MENPIISIIIPVYNTAQWLRVCVDSIVSQAVSGSQIEVILVDDGSTDDSPAICDAYGAALAFVSVIHKENGGLSDARNAGLATARGHYLLFVDSDDTIAPESLPAVLKHVENQAADLVFLQVHDLLPGGRLQDYGLGLTREKLVGLPKKEALDYLASLPKSPIIACAKLIDRALLLRSGHRFDSAYRSGEDLDFSLGLFMLCETFDYCPVDFYRYRRLREGSITHRTDAKKIRITLRIMDKWIARAEAPYAAYRDSIYGLLSYTYVVLLGSFGLAAGMSPWEKSGLRTELKNRRFLLKYAKNRKSKTIARLSRIIGLRGVMLLLELYLRRR